MKWYNVNADARVWAGHSDAHKQGWLYAPAAILAIEEYKGSYRFEEYKVEGGGYGDLDASSDYPDLWIRQEDVSTLPFEDEDDVSDELPVPPPMVGDAALGAAFRLLVNFVLGR